MKLNFKSFEVVCRYHGGDGSVTREDVIKALEEARHVFNFAKDAKEALRDIGSNYDHDHDAHKYGTLCRQCTASDVLNKYYGLGQNE